MSRAIIVADVTTRVNGLRRQEATVNFHARHVPE